MATIGPIRAALVASLLFTLPTQAQHSSFISLHALEQPPLIKIPDSVIQRDSHRLWIDLFTGNHQYTSESEKRLSEMASSFPFPFQYQTAKMADGSEVFYKICLPMPSGVGHLGLGYELASWTDYVTLRGKKPAPMIRDVSVD
jgi:hypothetical protein